MLNFFGFKKDIEIIKHENRIEEMDKLVEEIHSTFFTEVDRLLKEAKIAKSLEDIDKSLIEKSDRLGRLGFRKSYEFVKGNKEYEKKSAIDEINKQKQKIIEYERAWN